MSADSAVTYTSVHSEARSWSIPSEDPYEEAARQLLEQAPRSPESASAYYHSLHPSGTPPLLPIPLPAPSTSRRADIPEADTPPRKRLLLTTPRPGCEIGESSLAAARDSQEPTKRPESEILRGDYDRLRVKDRAAVRAEIEVLRRERLAYEQEGMETRQALLVLESSLQGI
ncbi:hypothetical protein Tco_0006007 [Tanacetum coccineum]